MCFNQVFLKPWVLPTRVQPVVSLSRGLTYRGSYDRLSYNQGFLHAGVVRPGVLTSRGFDDRGLLHREILLPGV